MLSSVFGFLWGFFFSAVALVLFVRSIQGLKHLGWMSPPGLMWWAGIILAFPPAYLAYRTAMVLPLGVAVSALAFGLIFGVVILAVVKPRWPASL